MKLLEFKNYILAFPLGQTFNYGISKPFSWRGSYDEVAFSIIESPSTREEILKNINLAYTETFYGYKGGEYEYNDFTYIHFEGGIQNYTNGEYVAEMIAKIENAAVYQSQEHRLVSLAFC